jgi:hypothetical protein
MELNCDYINISKEYLKDYEKDKSILISNNIDIQKDTIEKPKIDDTNLDFVELNDVKDEKLKNTFIFRRLGIIKEGRCLFKQGYKICFNINKQKLYLLKAGTKPNIFYYKIVNGILFIKDDDGGKDENGNKKNVNDITDIELLRRLYQKGDIIISLGFKELGIAKYDNLNKLTDNGICEVLYNYDAENLYIDDDYTEIFYSFYLDFDVDIKKDRYLNNNIKKCDTILKTSLECIVKTLKETLDFTINNNDIFIADANGDNELEKPNTYKYSKHIHLPIYTKYINELKILHTYLNTIIFNKNKYCFKDDKVVYDNSVYLKNNDGKTYRKWRMLNQTKPRTNRILKPFKLDGFGYSENVKDYNCMRYGVNNTNTLFIDGIDTKNKKININKIRELLNHNAKTNLGIDEKDNNIVYDCLDFKVKTSKNDELNYDNIVDIYRNYNDDIISLVECCLKVIPNDTKNKQEFTFWIKIGRILKNIGLKHYQNQDKLYDIFNKWTLQAYNQKDIIDANMKCKRIWNSLELNEDKNIGIPSLIVFATICDKDFNLKKMYVKNYRDFYDIDVKNYGYDIYTLKKDEYFKDVNVNKVLSYNLILVSLNVGEGKTEYMLNNILGDILIPFSNRILFGKDMTAKCKSAFGDNNVSFYLNDKYNTEFDTNKKAFIVSIQSLSKFDDYINQLISKGKQIVLFLDEFEALYDAVICDTTNKKLLPNFKSLVKLWKKAKLRIPVDAFISKRSFELIEILNKEAGIMPKKLFINADKRNLYPKTLTIKGISNDKYEKDLMEKLICIDAKKSLSNGDKLVIFSEFAEICNKLNKSLTDYGLTIEEILTITKDEKEDNIEKIEDIMNNTNKLIKYLCWIYNSCILNGVSFTENHFNIGYIIIGNFGISANDTLNASFRSRTTTNFNVYYLHSGCRGKRTLLKTFPLNDSIITDIRNNKLSADYNNIYKNDVDFNDILTIPDEYQKLYKYHTNIDKYTRQILINEVKYYNKDEFGNDNYDEKYLVDTIPKNNYENFTSIINSNNKDMKINIEKLILIGKRFNNFNNVFKYEILTKLAKDNGNIIKYDLINDYELTDDDYDSSYNVKNAIIDGHMKSHLEKHLTKHIQKDKDYDGYGKLKVKDINDVMENEIIENEKKRCNYVANIINYYYSHNKDLQEKLFKLCSISGYYEDFIYKLAILKNQKNIEKYIKTFNYKYIKALIEELNKHYENDEIDCLADIMELEFTNVELYNANDFKNKIKDIATESRKFYKKPIPTIYKKNKGNDIYNRACLKCFINDINEILEPVNIKFIAEKTDKEIRKIIKDDKGNKIGRIRFNKYSSIIKKTKDIYYNDDNGNELHFNLTIPEIIINFKEPEKRKYNFIVED